MKTIIMATGFIASTFFSCMHQMSECVEDKSKGFNGSFESVKENRPLNWMFYTSKTCGAGDFDITSDTTEYKEGKRSLKFEVRECSAAGGWKSPGFTKELDAKEGERYRIGFWIKNTGSNFRVEINAVNATKEANGPVLQSSEKNMGWNYHVYEYTIPEKMDRIKLQLNVLSPGIFWMDDVRVEKITN